MANEYKNIEHKYNQAKTYFRSYTNNFVSNATSGNISNKKIRKINVISMWLDFIQKYLLKQSQNSLYTSTVTYQNIDNILDIVSSEFSLIYKTIDESVIEEELSTLNQKNSYLQSSELLVNSTKIKTAEGFFIEIGASSKKLDTNSLTTNDKLGSSSNNKSRSSSNNRKSY